MLALKRGFGVLVLAGPFLRREMPGVSRQVCEKRVQGEEVEMRADGQEHRTPGHWGLSVQRASIRSCRHPQTLLSRPHRRGDLLPSFSNGTTAGGGGARVGAEGGPEVGVSPCLLGDARAAWGTRGRVG